jgi:2-haloacid dehalogenase
MFAQSLFHDHVPANRCALHSARIDRRRGSQGWGATPPPDGAVHFDFRVTSLSDLVAAHCAEHGGG